MLLENFYEYKLVKEESTILNFSVLFKADHEIYNGHFPNNPITPGVCILQTGKQLLESFLEKEIKIKLISDVKFIKLIQPSNTEYYYYTITLPQLKTDQVLSSELIIKKDGIKYTVAKLVYEI